MKTFILFAAIWYLASPLLKKNPSDEYWLICSISACILMCIRHIIDQIEKLNK